MNKTIRSAARVSSDLAHLARREWEEAATIVGSSALIDGKPLFATAMTDARMVQQVRDLLARSGRVHLPEAFGAEAVKPIFEACRDAEYQLVFKGSRTNYDFSAKDVAALEVGHKVALIESIHAQATTGFQYLYDSYRRSDFAEAGTLAPGVLADLFAALNTDATLALFRAMTGDDRIAYVDAQLTRYRPGHFLTAHDDHHAEKHRLFAYVINLTAVWRADWGGLLMFLGDDGHIAEAYTPRWNALNILKVPQPHAVSVVAPFAHGARYSITGWMRAKKP